MEKVLYKGKRELTMAQFEALSSIDENTDYNIMDYPDNGMTNAQLSEVLNYSRLFSPGYITICLDDGAFGKGHIVQLQLVDDVRTWVNITADIHVDLSGYIQFTDIINTLNSTASDKPLSALQGKNLNDTINTLDGQNVKITGNQTVAGTKNFTGTFQIGGKTISYDSSTDTFTI